MPFRSRSGTRPGRATQSLRRKTAWTSGPGSTANTVVTSSTVAFLGSAIVPQVEGLTIVRIRGELEMHLSLATNSNDGFRGAIGIGLATTAAVVAGIASVSTPITEEDAEIWLWHRYFACNSPVPFTAGAAQDGPDIASSLRLEVDTRAMRKYPSEMSLYAVIEPVETGVATLNVSFNTRMLVKLP